MGDEYERQKREDRLLATMYRLDPDKLAAVRRATSGKTRCPECDALNPADQKKCYNCGARLYYDLPDDEEPKGEGQDGNAEEQKAEESKPGTDRERPPYY